MNDTPVHRPGADYPEAQTSVKVFAGLAAVFVSLTLIGGVLGLFQIQADGAAVVAVDSARTALVG